MKQPIDLRPDHAKIVHEIIARHLPAGVSVRVFGSRAKWTAKPHSDLDLALKGKEPLPRSVLGDLAEAFSESDLPFRVDVVDWYTVTPTFQAVIDRDAQALRWPIVTLGEVASEITVGHVGSMANEYVPEGIPFLRSLNIAPYRILSQDLKFISPDFHKRLKKSALKPGDVVIVRTGKPGVCSVIPNWLSDANCSDLVIVRCGSELRPRYLAYWANSLAAHHIGSNLVGAVQQHFNVGAARQMPISLPLVEEQDRILSVLGTMDDKIELNRRMNETLEGMAQAIFRDWFVDFGPVRRKAAGETDAVAIMGGLTPDPARAANLAALFPDAFGDDALPVGWTETAIGDLVKPLGGSTPRTGDEALWSPPRHYWATPKDLSNMTDPALFQTARQISDAGLGKITSGLLPPGSVLLSSRAPIGYLAIAQVPVAINQGFIGLVPTAEVGSSYLYCWCKANMDKIVANANGSTFQEISKKNFRPITSAFPADRRLIAEFGLVADPLFARLIAAAIESRTLTETRDYLLPRLMSGTVRVACESEAA
ncbi:restriction endonuclease subunit S [Novosphingobium sp. KA1]|uniref:restriction endonuclease subunit S n=1 Tax=Novosphingobium sp. (strain KA1) TaxID=164608 RepID=UPI001A909A83|nr:restriction endonuclease subunit S [Novosphingobium sp. KA1]QSR17356.1 hypothetical protein CA833_09200 [Novosphingobium sp. KA1]